MKNAMHTQTHNIRYAIPNINDFYTIFTMMVLHINFHLFHMFRKKNF